MRWTNLPDTAQDRAVPRRNLTSIDGKAIKRPAPPVLSSAAWLHPFVAFDEFQEEPLPIRSEWPTCAEPVELLVQLLQVWSALSV